jgi:membrane protease YdiL (CAAX protease family)
MSRRRGSLAIPDGRDAALQAAYYVVNGLLEEGFFRGLLQGGIGVLAGPLAGFVAGTAMYVVYHRLGRWPWPDVLATALVGVPLGLAFWLLPGPPSLLGVSIAHIGATCGYLGVGPYLLHRLRLL